jgi:hypothetical protein
VEGQAFTVYGTVAVQYGAGSSWAQRYVSGTGQCTNEFFSTDPAYGIVKSCRVAGGSAALTTVAIEGQSFSFAGSTTVQYGVYDSWISKTLSGAGLCTNEFFGADPAVGIVKSCVVDTSAVPTATALSTTPTTAPPAPTVTPATATPATPTYGGVFVDTTNLPIPQPGIDYVTLANTGVIPALPAPTDWEHDGAFRVLCNWSHMSFDDPIVYPAQPGVAHHHTFFGNTGIDAFSTSENIRAKGKATCRGGTINMSGYWVPSMIDTATHKPIVPRELMIYYKTGLYAYMNDNSVLQPVPKGLKMIAGNSAGSAPGIGSFECLIPSLGVARAGSSGRSIPAQCQPGDRLRTILPFPQCWDGVNLDSPDHKSHMAYPIAFWTGDPYRQYRCPASHPVVLPQITYLISYDVPGDGNTSTWRLSSDVYDASKPGGYSLHGDWMNGWDPAISDLWGVVCIRDRRNCGAANLGDGRMTLEFQGN